MSIDVLAFSPHPDDLELASSGTLAKIIDSGSKVGIIDLTKGEKGTYGNAKKRVRESEKARDILGAQFRNNMDLGDCKLNDSFEKSKEVASKIREYKPDVLFCPYGDNTHPDHKNGRELVEKGAFFSKLKKIQLDENPHKIKGIIYYMTHLEFDPSFVVDVSDYYDKKREIMRAYESQEQIMKEQGGLFNLVEMRDRRFGVSISGEYGEPFYVDDIISVDDPLRFFK